MIPARTHLGRVDIPLTGYAPHRTGRADFPHPAPHEVDSLARSVSDRFSLLKHVSILIPSLCMGMVSQ